MITLPIAKIELGAWMPILGSGIGIPVTQEVTLKAFLCDQIAIPPDYLDHHIQTILVNGQPVDEVDHVYIGHEDIIALSAAMPGLAGTTLRRGGHLAAMRHSITRPCDTAHGDTCRVGVVTLKLFNLVAREMGPKILGGDILLKSKDLQHLLNRYPHLRIPQESSDNTEWIEVQLQTEPTS